MNTLDALTHPGSLPQGEGNEFGVERLRVHNTTMGAGLASLPVNRKGDTLVASTWNWATGVSPFHDSRAHRAVDVRGGFSRWRGDEAVGGAKNNAGEKRPVKNESGSWNGSTATLFTGIAMIVGSLVVAVAWPHVGALSIVGLVWGSLLVCSGLFFNQRANRLERDHAFRLAQLEERRHATELKRGLLESVLKDGLPDGVSREWLERMLNWQLDDVVQVENERRTA